jgi:branched-chain amino acid transport system substrate-binding protein
VYQFIWQAFSNAKDLDMVSLDMASRSLAVAVGAFLLAASQPALAEKKYGPGVTDTSIKFGQTMPYSGGASGLSAVGRVQTAYFKMINAQGGINGRAINLISKDDGFSPPKTVEQTRSLVEGDEVLAMFSSMGSAPNLSVAKYLNSAQVPQIMALAGTPKAIDPVNFPWTTTFYSTLTGEAKVLAAYLLEVKPNAKIGILYQNDESGRTYLEGMRAGLGDKAGTMIVKEVGFDLSYPTIDSQIILLQSSGADTVFVASAAPKFGAQSIRKIGELGWKPYLILAPGASVIETSLKPAGLQYAVGAVSVQFYKQPGDSKWDADPGMMEYYTFMKKWAPAEVPEDALAVIGYSAAQMLIDTLKRCGDNLTRENLIYEATHIKDYEPTLFLPGVKVNVTPESRIPWRQRQITQFDGTNWTFVGGVVTAAGER